MLRKTGLPRLVLAFATIGAASIGATSFAGVIRSNYYHGTMCQAQSSAWVLYADNGVRADLHSPPFPPPPPPQFISLVCPAPWSVDSGTAAGSQPPPLRTFSFEAYWTTNTAPAPTCTVIINTITNGLTLIGSPHQSVDQTTPTKNTANSNTQTFPTGLLNDVRRAYMLCTGVGNTGGIDGYTLNTCVGTALDCPPS